MGRPRALKNVDKVPSIDIDGKGVARRTRSHVTFDEDEDAAEKLESQLKQKEEIIVEPKPKHEGKRQKKAEKVVEEEEPEEIVANSVEIQQLRELYEQSLSASATRQRKKRRVAEQMQEVEEIDAGLVEAALAAVQKEKERENQVEIDESANEISKSSEKGKIKIINKSLKIALVDEKPLNPMKYFKVSKEIMEFNEKRKGAVERVKYTTFISQRKLGPAKQFKS